VPINNINPKSFDRFPYLTKPNMQNKRSAEDILKDICYELNSRGAMTGCDKNTPLAALYREAQENK
jgi:hypothetical protein